MKIVALLQARMGSVRLPNKVMRKMGGIPMIELMLGRLSNASRIDQIVLATSDDPKNIPLVEHVRSLGYEVFCGSENDVLDRFYRAALHYEADAVIRVTGDCPLIDPRLVDAVIAEYQKGGVDYVSNIEPPTFPDGLDVEIFSFDALEKSAKTAVKPNEREHVTPLMRASGLLKRGNVAHTVDCSAERWTVDEPADFEVVEAIFNHFRPRTDFSWTEVLQIRQTEPKLFKANEHIKRNEGAELDISQKLWKRSRRVISDNNTPQFEASEIFSPGQWSTFFSKAKGCKVWDLDGREYVDMSLGIATSILGYGHPEVDDTVRARVDAGNTSTFGGPDEVYLAEKLVEMHPWADTVRFARSGDEANAIAIRIARAATGKSKVAICGHHGWHDWYIAANLADEGDLAAHLLPSLESSGVPQGVYGTILPFSYNRFDELEALVNAQDIGVIKMEVSGNEGTGGDFLQKVRDLATTKGIVLAFDECSSGFRQSFGGFHKIYGVEPDIAVFGEAMANGYSIAATIGKRAVMEAAQKTFVGGNVWTEHIGAAAALKTLEVMERTRSWERVTEAGAHIKQGWVDLAVEMGLEIDVWGLSSSARLSIRSKTASTNLYGTYIAGELQKKGFLAKNGVCLCIDHDDTIVEAYFSALKPIFSKIRDCEDSCLSHTYLSRLERK